MPNWCDNSMHLTHEDKTKIDALVAELQKKEGEGIFQLLRPNPSGEWDYNWSVENWGTKWDADIIDWDRQDDNTIWISFNSAWSPPSALYEFLAEEGWVIEAYYHESGMCFCGKFTNEDGDEYYEYDFTDRASLEALPSDIEDFTGLLDYQDECKENGDFDEEEVD
jgi:Ferredoxin-like domain in Api92-like protein